MNKIELFGILSSVVVLISLRFDGKRFRILNALGSFMYVVYGLLITSYSVLILNGCCFVMNIYKLVQMKKGDKRDEKGDCSWS